MGKSKAHIFAGISTLILVLMVASIPFVHPSRLQGRTPTMAGKTGSKGMHIYEAERFGKGRGDRVFKAVEEMARQVPGGPDPLHHNSNPFGP
ncbi:hypothetical protein EV1_005699 [Malus domestica]